MPPRPSPHAPPPPAERGVAVLAARAHGTVAVAELRRCGLDKRAVSRRVAKGWLHPRHRGVCAVGHPALTLRGRLMAAVKACGPTAVLSHVSAAMLLGFLDERDHVPHVTVLGSWARRHPGIVVHRSDRIASTIVDGIPVTTAALTRSELEDALLDVIHAGDLRPPDVNVALRLDGRVVVCYLRWPAQRLVVERTHGAGRTRRWRAPKTPSARRSSRPMASRSCA